MKTIHHINNKAQRGQEFPLYNTIDLENMAFRLQLQHLASLTHNFTLSTMRDLPQVRTELLFALKTYLAEILHVSSKEIDEKLLSIDELSLEHLQTLDVHQRKGLCQDLPSEFYTALCVAQDEVGTASLDIPVILKAAYQEVMRMNSGISLQNINISDN